MCKTGGVVQNFKVLCSCMCESMKHGVKLPILILSSSLPMSNRMRKKLLKKTSYQRTKEEFEAIREKRRKKKEVTFFSLLIIMNCGPFRTNVTEYDVCDMKSNC